MTVAIAGERNKRLYKKVKAALPAEMHDTLDELLDELESDFTEAKESHDADLSSVEADSDGMRGALETVKYALHDVIYLGKPLQIMPRRLLEIVEDAIR